ncbi:MAG: hypothetical protein ABL998_01140 [Planctomycetota bacterium]
MKFAILWREPCFRWLALTLPMVMLATWPMAALPATLTFGRDFGYGDMLYFRFPLLVAWGPALAFLPLRPKVWSYEAALPLSLLDLLRTRIAAFFLALAVPVLGLTLVFLALREGRVVAPVLRIAANLLTLAGALALLPFAWSPTSSRVSVLQAGGLVLVALVLVELVQFSWSGAVYLVLIPVLYWRFQHGTPVVFRQEERGGKAASARLFDGWLEGLSPLRLVIWRSTFLRPRGLLMLVALVFVAFVPFNPGLLWLFFQGPWVFVRLGLNVLNGIDALPMSRARLAVPALLPPLLALLAGVWLQRGTHRPLASWSLLAERVQLDSVKSERLGQEGAFENHVVGPASLWRLHTGPEPLIVTAPWGESARLAPHPIFWGANVSVVNPYDVEAASSVRFLGWQLARAVEATTGVRVSEEELLAPYPVRGGKNEAEVVGDLRSRVERDEDLAQPPPRPVPRRGMLVYMAVAVIWSLAVALVLCGRVPPADERAWRWRLAGRVLGIGAIAGVLIAVLAVEIGDHVVLPVLMSITERKLDALLGSSVFGWLGLLAAFTTSVLVVAARRLPRIEVPTAPKVGWGREEAPVF